jgi:hypothetical protein
MNQHEDKYFDSGPASHSSLGTGLKDPATAIVFVAILSLFALASLTLLAICVKSMF